MPSVKHKFIATYLLLGMLVCSMGSPIVHADEVMKTQQQHSYTNALIHESSPYLQQHAHNPVNWLAWGEDAFALARLQDKPILVSIGYSTCHWCHVMEEESFEDPEVAAVLNRYFITIKVDREERPDVDAIYMRAAQMINGSGGWPLNVLLTPDQKPFYATTYLPKHSRFGRMGLIELAESAGQAWLHDRKNVEASADSIANALKRNINLDYPASKEARIDNALIDQAYMETAKSFDYSHGGFGDRPKFPTPQRLLFLMRYAVLQGQPEALVMVEKTLNAMQRGGIHDQLGGGFHRYSTDASWLLPHFEKMLYDQALLMMTYAEASVATGNQSFAATARDIADYIIRDMRHSEGAFYSAEDADSEGIEGKFYVWSAHEIEAVLGQRAHAFMQAYGVNKAGNFTDETTHKPSGENILYQPGPVQQARFADDLHKLMAIREQRPRPFRDDKILTDWNGLSIAALALTGRLLHDSRYTLAASQAASFILQHLRDDQGLLLHRWRDGKTAINGQLEDYTSMVWGLSELYAATLEPHWLDSALQLNAIMLQRFRGEHGGLYQTDKDHALIARPMEIYDAAMPSGNAVAMHNLLRLSRLTGDSTLAAEAAKLARHFTHIAKRAPSGVLHMLSASLMAQSKGKEIVFAGNKTSDRGIKMLALSQQYYHPNTVVLWQHPELQILAPFTEGQVAIDGKVTAYVCENFQCNRPTTDINTLKRYLQ